MSNVNVLAVVVATVAAFVLSSAWKTVLAPGQAGSVQLMPWRLGGLGGTLVLALAFAAVAGHFAIVTWPDAVVLAMVCVPPLVLSSAVVWDRVTVRLAAVRSGDWLVKLLVIATVVGVWH
jgi:hypothetical protein